MTNALTGVASIKVAPGIGLARVGNSTLTGGDEYFIGPETPGVVPSPATTGANGSSGYKDPTGAMKRQAQRFRVFGYDASGKLLGEITETTTVNGSAVSLNWDVHVTNMKSANYAFQGKYAFDPAQMRNSTIQPDMEPHLRDKLIIDPGSMSISGTSQGPVELNDNGSGSTIFDISDTDAKPISGRLKYDPPQTVPSDCSIDIAIPVTYTPATVSLGRLYTDEDGRLVFVGGEGRSESCTTPKVVISKVVIDQQEEPNPEYNGNSYFNNPGWFDDTCGGSVNCTVCSGDGTSVNLTTTGNAASQGWVAVAPPHYAPASNNVVSLLDLQMDIFPQADPYTGAGPALFYGGGQNSVLTALTTDPDLHDLQVQSEHGVETDVIASLSATVFQSIPYLAASNSTGQVFFGTLFEGASSPFAAVSGAPEALGPGGLTVFQGKIFHAYQSTDGLMMSLFVPGETPSYAPVTTSFDNFPYGGTAAAAFNGQVYVTALSYDVPTVLNLGNSKSADTNAFTFTEITLPSGITLPETRNQPVGMGMTVHRNRLCIAFVNDGGIITIASSLDGKDFTFTEVAIGGAVVTANIDTPALALSSFDGLLYLCYITEAEPDPSYNVLSSVDGEIFDLHTTNFAQSIPAAATNVPVNFYRDIYPTLKTVTDYAWTNERAFHGHRPGATGDFLTEDYLLDLANPSLFSAVHTNPGAQPNLNIARPFVYSFIRPPAQDIYLGNLDGSGTPAPYRVPAPPEAAVPDAKTQIITSGPGVKQRADLMPRLFGNGGSPAENSTNNTSYPNQWLPLTDHQLEKFQHWVNGDFTPGVIGDAANQYTKLANGSDVPLPDQLSIAALQPTVGGGFHPGIELTYLMHEDVFFDSAFRFASGTIEGSIAAYMSIPWQGDFWSCNISWWPALRPDIVVEQKPAVVSAGQTGDQPPVLSHTSWFRGPRIPPDSNNISDYEGGYDVMVDDWHLFGLVTPVAGETNQGQQVFSETERDASLEKPSLLISINSAQASTGLALTNTSTGVGTQAISDTSADQAWRIVANPATAGEVYVTKAMDETVLTVDFSTGAVSLAARKTPADASQIFTYVASGSDGYPGHFKLVSKINLQMLGVDSGGAVATVDKDATGDNRLWLLDTSLAAVD